MSFRSSSARAIAITACAASLLALAFGIRAVLGVFISPLNTATGLGFAVISFALALSQLASGLAQPVCGALADRHGPARVIFAGGLMLACGLALLPLATSVIGLAAAFCLIAVAYAAVGSTPTLIGAVTRTVPEARRGIAIGIVSAGGSIGQLVIAPATQIGIAALGWAGAIFALALFSLAALPASCILKSAAAPAVASDATSASATAGTRDALRAAFSTPSYWLICGSFFVCGFHVSFLLAHMPGVIDLCGLPSQLTGIWLGVLGLGNVAGSVLCGFVLKRFAMTRILFAVYALRASGVALFLLVPTSQATMLGFAVWMGLTYMATLPPTSGLVAKLFGTHHLGSTFGVVMLAHQLGSFLGVWLGGLAVSMTGSYDWIWRIDIVLALLAAGLSLPIRESSARMRSAARLRLGTQAA